MNKRFGSIIFVVLLLLSFTACSVFDAGDRFVCGALLDDDLMSDIRKEIFGPQYEDVSTADTENVEDSDVPYESETETLDNEKTNETDTEGVVYWTKSGKVWHTSKDCGSLKNSKEILSGSVETAKTEGKEKLCSYCEKRDKD